MMTSRRFKRKILSNFVLLQDCLLHHMDISVSESEKRTTPALNIRDCYTVYLVETRYLLINFPSVKVQAVDIYIH